MPNLFLLIYSFNFKIKLIKMHEELIETKQYIVFIIICTIKNISLNSSLKRSELAF